MTKKHTNNFSVILLSLIIIIINEPLLSRIVQGAGILALMLLFFIVNIGAFIPNGVVKNNSLLIGLIYIIVIIIYRLLGISDDALINYYYQISFLFFAIVAMPVIVTFTEKQQNVLLSSVIISVIVMMITNIQLANQYGIYYVRLEDYYRGLTNSMNTQYLSALIIFCGVLFAKIKLSRKYNIATIALLVFSCYYIISVGQRLIAILLLVAMLMLQIGVAGKKSIKKYLVLILIFIFGAFLLLNYENALCWVSKTIGNDRVTYRINQLLFALTSKRIQGAGGSLEARFDLINTSLNTFFSTPLSVLFGSGAHDIDNTIIGNHSQWIDHAAKYGVCGCILLFLVIKRCFKDTVGYLGMSKKALFHIHFVIMVLYFFVRGIIGAVLYPYFGVVLFVFLPLVYLKIYSTENGTISK